MNFKTTMSLKSLIFGFCFIPYGRTGILISEHGYQSDNPMFQILAHEHPKWSYSIDHSIPWMPAALKTKDDKGQTLHEITVMPIHHPQNSETVGVFAAITARSFEGPAGKNPAGEMLFEKVESFSCETATVEAPFSLEEKCRLLERNFKLALYPIHLYTSKSINSIITYINLLLNKDKTNIMVKLKLPITPSAENEKIAFVIEMIFGIKMEGFKITVYYNLAPHICSLPHIQEDQGFKSYNIDFTYTQLVRAMNNAKKISNAINAKETNKSLAQANTLLRPYIVYNLMGQDPHFFLDNHALFRGEEPQKDEDISSDDEQ